MARLSRSRWPTDGPVRDLLLYLDALHSEAGYPSLSEIGRSLALAPSTLSAFFTGARLIGRGNLELLVEFLEGDVQRAEGLRRKAVVAWVRRGEREQQVVAIDGAVADSGSRLDVVLYTAPVNTLNRPTRLVGRDDLLERLHRLLDAADRVLLHGLGGCGKTALAASVADQRVESGNGPYLWLRPGDSDHDTMLDGLLRTLATPGDQAKIGTAVGDAQLQGVRQLLVSSGIRLVVIDDVWSPQVLHGALRMLPDGVPVLVTSRLKIDIGQLVEVGDLKPDDAIELLTLHARRTLPQGAVELCREVGYHPYALEIAGRHLHQYESDPNELGEHLRQQPHALPMPGGFASHGRESVQRLLDRSFAALDSDDARRALAAIGAFGSGAASVELVAAHLGFDLDRTRRALNRLVDVSLARRIPGTSQYSVHDLTFAYARGIDSDDGIPTITQFVRMHIRDYPLLALEMDNLLSAATAARTSDPDSFLVIVEALATGGYLDDYGHTLRLLRLLDEAIELVRPTPERCHTLLTKRGNAAYNQGEHEQAIALYVQALDIAPVPRRRIILMSLIGKVLAELTRHDEAEEQFQQAYEMALTINDEHSRLRILEQHSVAAFREGNYQRVRDLTREGLELSRRLRARFQEAIFLNNLGTAEFELGVCKAIALHKQAQDIAEEMDNDHVRALTYRTLGADYHAQERFEDAHDHFIEALTLYGRLGQSAREAKLRHFLRQFGYLDHPTAKDA